MRLYPNNNPIVARIIGVIIKNIYLYILEENYIHMNEVLEKVLFS